MGLIIIDRIIMFFLCLMIFFLPISKAVIEVSASICIAAWFLKRAFILQMGEGRNFCNRILGSLFASWTSNKLLFVFIFANLLSVVFSSDITLSITAFVLKLMEYILIFIIVRDTVSSKLRFKIIITVMLFSMLFIGLDGLFQIVSGCDLFRDRQLFKNRVTASFINPNDLGSYLITTIPLGLALIFGKFNKKIKSALIIASVIALAVLMLTLSKGAGCAFLLALVFFGFYTKKRYVLFILGGMFIIVLILPLFFNFNPLDISRRALSFINDPGAVDRKYLWAAALRMFAYAPFFGVGLGTFMENYHRFWIKPTTEISYAHNCYLQTLAETGIVGLSAFMLLLFAWFKKTLKVLSKPRNSFCYFSFLGLSAGLTAYLLNSFVDTNFYSLPIAVLFWFVFGLQQAGRKIIESE